MVNLKDVDSNKITLRMQAKMPSSRIKLHDIYKDRLKDHIIIRPRPSIFYLCGPVGFPLYFNVQKIYRISMRKK